MTDKLLIDRELLERVASEFEHDNDRYMLGRELRKILDAPRQPEGDYSVTPNLQDVTVVGYAAQQDLDWHGDCTLRKTAMLDYDTPLCRLSDHLRAIAELREERDTLRQQLTELDVIIERLETGIPRIQEQSHQMRQQRDKLDAEIERLRVKLMTIASAEPGRHNIEWAKAMAATGNNEAYAKWREAFDQRAKLAGLLREVRVIVAREVERWTRSAAILPVNANVESGLLTRIDAALAEVKP